LDGEVSAIPNMSGLKLTSNLLNATTTSCRSSHAGSTSDKRASHTKAEDEAAQKESERKEVICGVQLVVQVS